MWKNVPSKSKLIYRATLVQSVLQDAEKTDSPNKLQDPALFPIYFRSDEQTIETIGEDTAYHIIRPVGAGWRTKCHILCFDEITALPKII